MVTLVADAAVAGVGAAPGRPLRVVDPACGDGRFLVAVVRRLRAAGVAVVAVGVDIDADAVDATARSLDEAGVDAGTGGTHHLICADALELDWSSLGSFDIVIGNPPFLSQMATSTSRGGASDRGGGPYADAAAEFVALAGEIVDPNGGRVAMVLPQSLLSARDAGPIRATFDERASLVWSWWTGERVFDANVYTCALMFEFGTPSPNPDAWSRVITDRQGVPDVPVTLAVDGVLGDRCRLNANFRDEYYGMVPAVGDHAGGPLLITSGLIDPGHCWWGERPITFAKQRFERPRLDLACLDAKMARWAADRLVPKVLIANQTKIIEAIVDADGSMLPGVPVVAAYPHAAVGPVAGAVVGSVDRAAVGGGGGGGGGVVADDVETLAWQIAAVLTSPVASAWAWHRNAGTGLSADAIRIGPVMLAALPWPAGDLALAVEALRRRDVRACAAAVHAAYGIADSTALDAWWTAALRRIEARRPTDVTAAPTGR